MKFYAVMNYDGAYDGILASTSHRNEVDSDVCSRPIVFLSDQSPTIVIMPPKKGK